MRQTSLDALDYYYSVDNIKGSNDRTIKLKIETEKMGMEK